MSTPQSFSTPARAGTALIGAFALAAATVLAGVAGPAAAATVTTTFDTPGGPYTVVVPSGVSSAHVVLQGGSGGQVSGWNLAGGAGALVTADIPVTAGQTLVVYVAGNGGSPQGGANGGGDAGLGVPTLGGGGGGASDIRTASGELSDRILVAAGGGGASFYGAGGDAGEDGSVDSAGCASTATAGTATAGGTATMSSPYCSGVSGTDGQLGVGGSGGVRTGGNNSGGGGGGGLYGGAGGSPWGSGAGGSSYIGPGATDGTIVTGTPGAAPFVTVSFEVVAQLTAASSSPTLTADGSSTLTVTATVTAAGEPFSGETVAFESSDPDQGIGPVTDNGDGTYSAVLTASTTVGSTVITARVLSEDPELSTTVTIVQTAVEDAPGPGLAETGSAVAAPVILAGLVLLVLGGGAMLVSRRRRADVS